MQIVRVLIVLRLINLRLLRIIWCLILKHLLRLLILYFLAPTHILILLCRWQFRILNTHISLDLAINLLSLNSWSPSPLLFFFWLKNLFDTLFNLLFNSLCDHFLKTIIIEHHRFLVSNATLQKWGLLYNYVLGCVLNDRLNTLTDLLINLNSGILMLLFRIYNFLFLFWFLLKSCCSLDSHLSFFFTKIISHVRVFLAWRHFIFSTSLDLINCEDLKVLTSS